MFIYMCIYIYVYMYKNVRIYIYMHRERYNDGKENIVFGHYVGIYRDGILPNSWRTKCKRTVR